MANKNYTHQNETVRKAHHVSCVGGEQAYDRISFCSDACHFISIYNTLQYESSGASLSRPPITFNWKDGGVALAGELRERDVLFENASATVPVTFIYMIFRYISTKHNILSCPHASCLFCVYQPVRSLYTDSDNIRLVRP